MGRWYGGHLPAIPTLVLWPETLQKWAASPGVRNVRMFSRDDGDVYSATSFSDACGSIPASISVVSGEEEVEVESFGSPTDAVRILVRPPGPTVPVDNAQEGLPASSSVRAYLRQDNTWQQIDTMLVPATSDLFARHKGILETDVIAGCCVLIVGVGSGGSSIGQELAKSGVKHFILVDPDRLELENIVRHASPISDLGRFKTKSVRDLIKGKNPAADVQTFEVEVTWENKESVRHWVRQCDLVIVGADSMPARAVLNKLCVEEKKPCIIAGVKHRAFGGQVLRIRPYETLCHQCYVRLFPDEVADAEVSSQAHADRMAYANHPAVAEPGLATDIAPVNTMVTKLAIQELLRGKPTTLRSLDEDLSAPLYLWLNRRETDSPFAGLEPLGCGVDGLRILRWYGIPAEKDPACPVCGDFMSQLVAETGSDVGEEDIAKFAPLCR
jgi:molybdopterin/thiamine biosynthesis adenylyltransferase